MARTMALCSLPRTNPGNRLQYRRVNGPYKLVMIAGADKKLPYGNLPRLLLAWISTEAVRTQSRMLVLGDSLSEFMRELGIYSTSGRRPKCLFQRPPQRLGPKSRSGPLRSGPRRSLLCLAVSCISHSSLALSTCLACLAARGESR